MCDQFVSVFLSNPKDWNAFMDLASRGADLGEVNLYELGAFCHREGDYAGMLTWAAYHKQEELFERIAEKDNDKERQLSALLYCVDVQDVHWLRLLRKNGYDLKRMIGSPGRYGLIHRLAWDFQEALGMECEIAEILAWFVPSIDYLLESGVDINSRTDQGFTVLTTVMGKSHLEARLKIVDLLLERNARPDMPSRNGANAIHLAGDYGVEYMRRFLRVSNIYLSGRNLDEGSTPLHTVLESYYAKDLVELLLKHGVEPDEYTMNLQTPLSMVSTIKYYHHSDNLLIAQILLEHGANPAALVAPDPLEPLIMKLRRDPGIAVSLEMVDLISKYDR